VHETKKHRDKFFFDLLSIKIFADLLLSFSEHTYMFYVFQSSASAIEKE